MGAVKFEVGDDRTKWSGGEGISIEISPDADGDDGDDGLICTIVIKKPKPDRPKPRLHILGKAAVPAADDQDTSGAEAWYAHMLS